MKPDKSAPRARLPLRWRIALYRMVAALFLAFGGFCYAGFLAITGSSFKAMAVVGLTMVVSRALAGPLYGFGRE